MMGNGRYGLVNQTGLPYGILGRVVLVKLGILLKCVALADKTPVRKQYESIGHWQESCQWHTSYSFLKPYLFLKYCACTLRNLTTNLVSPKKNSLPCTGTEVVGSQRNWSPITSAVSSTTFAARPCRNSRQALRKVVGATGSSGRARKPSIKQSNSWSLSSSKDLSFVVLYLLIFVV